MTTAVKDPYLIDEKALESLEGAAKSSTGGGVFCPRKNPALHGECAVCKVVSQLFNGSESDKNIARRIMAKCTWFGNVIFPQNPNKIVLLEMGKKAGDDILYGMKKKEGWGSITNPAKGKGRELTLTKYRGEGGRNAYSVELALDRAEYDVPKPVLDNLYDLDTIIELLKTEDIFRVSSELKIDERLTFRLLPPWDATKNWPLMFVYRHWGVTEEQVRGEKPVELLEVPSTFDSEGGSPSTTEAPPWEEEKTRAEEPAVETKSGERKPPCFGRPVVFEAESEECLSCKFYRACAKEVSSKEGK
jgi:hypothetical protein